MKKKKHFGIKKERKKQTVKVTKRIEGPPILEEEIADLLKKMKMARVQVKCNRGFPC